jgi:hypothetical protein
MAKQPDNRLKDTEIAAAVASATIIVGFLVYWIVQIQDVREMLELAYG